jgi:hypothetical protein
MVIFHSYVNVYQRVVNDDFIHGTLISFVMGFDLGDPKFEHGPSHGPPQSSGHGSSKHDARNASACQRRRVSAPGLRSQNLDHGERDM